MADNTGIEWTDATWNPVTGCAEVSPGCDHCYAKTFAERWRGTEGHYFEHGFDIQLRPDKLDQPLRWKKPRKIFVNSMSDLFHDSIPDEYIARVWAVMALAPQHTFQVLTKRHGRMRSLLNDNKFLTLLCETGERMVRERINLPRLDDRIFRRGPWPLPNVWLGVSAENQQWANIRIPALLGTPAAVRFVSAEPLLGPINLESVPPLVGGIPSIDWVIVGGESGHNDRPMHVDWVRSLRDQCTEAGVSFLFKQWGETVPLGQMTDAARQRWDDHHGCDLYPDESLWRVGKKRAGRELDGRTWDEYPAAVTHE